MRLKSDLDIGARYGRLTVRADLGGRPRMYDCECSCGERKTVSCYDLIRGNDQSCGCWRRLASARRMKQYHAARRAKKEQVQ